MAQDGKSFGEDLKRKELKEKRTRLESERKNILEEAEAAKAANNFLKAKDLYMRAAEISKDSQKKNV